jgi:hypothetical protein
MSKKKEVMPEFAQPSSSSDDITASFAEHSEKSEFTEILKELFDKKKLKMITRLSSDEIRLITRIKMCAKLKKIDIWNQGVDLFMELLISKDGLSRKEMLEAVIGYQQRRRLNVLNPATWGSKTT